MYPLCIVTHCSKLTSWALTEHIVLQLTVTLVSFPCIQHPHPRSLKNTEVKDAASVSSKTLVIKLNSIITKYAWRLLPFDLLLQQGRLHLQITARI